MTAYVVIVGSIMQCKINKLLLVACTNIQWRGFLVKCSPSSCGSHNAGSMPPTAAADDVSMGADKPADPEGTYVSPDSISLPSNFLLALPKRPAHTCVHTHTSF